jgi:hypothetical protein
MDVTMVVFHIFPRYKKNKNKNKFIEIIEKKICLSKAIHNQLSKNEKIKSKSWITNK